MNAELNAGRDRDALIQENVFGATWKHDPCMVLGGEWLRMPNEHGVGIGRHPIFAVRNPLGCGFLVHDRCPYYSSDIAAAFLVVEKMRELGFDFYLHCYETPDVEHLCMAIFKAHNSLGTGVEWRGTGPVPELAICRAALAAVADSPFPSPVRQNSGEPEAATVTPESYSCHTQKIVEMGDVVGSLNDVLRHACEALEAAKAEPETDVAHSIPPNEMVK